MKKSGVFILAFFLGFVLVMNMFFCLDIILVIRYPFSSPEKRLKYYMIIATVKSCLWAFSSILDVKKIVFMVNRYLLLGTTIMFWALAIISTVYALIKLCRPGIS